MLQDQRMGVVQLVKRDVDHQVLFGQCHVLIHLDRLLAVRRINIWDKTCLKSFVEVADFAEIIQELVDPGFIVLYKRIESHHVRLLRVGRLICQVLQHLGNLKSS
jgi:hypothetical protein